MSVENKKMENYISEFKKFVIQKTNEEIIEESKISPVFNILCQVPDQEKPALALVPVPNDLFRDSRSKDLLADKIIPTVLQKIKEEGAMPICISMITEGWTWEVTEEESKKLSFEEIKKTKEKTEVVMISFETMEVSEVHVYNKMGTKKNAQGEYIEGVYLKERQDAKPTQTKGRFTNIFKKLQNA